MKIITISSGRNLIIPVYGEHYAQKKKQTTLKELLVFKENRFSLAPRDNYQKQAGWPNYPFANVCPEGKFVSSKENWLGYIAPPLDLDSRALEERDEYVRKLIKLAEVAKVTVHGKIMDERKEGGDLGIILFCSRKSIDENYARFYNDSGHLRGGWASSLVYSFAKWNNQLPLLVRLVYWIGFWEIFLIPIGIYVLICWLLRLVRKT